jgi:hypothetical protein
MLIIEGPDAAGKSTLIKKLREDYGFTHVIKPYYPKKNQLSYYLHTSNIYGGYALERYYISELVYPRFKKNRDEMDPHHQYLIEAALHPHSPIIFYLRPSKETILENIRKRGDDYIDESEIDSMLESYDFIINRSTIPHIKYDFKKDNLKEKFEKALDIQVTHSMVTLPFKAYMSSGNTYDKGRLMFIGDKPSYKSMGEGFIKAFISNKGSSEFFHKCLYEAGIYDKEMPYFTNWDKGYETQEEKFEALKIEIETLQPRKVICLGQEVAKKCGIGGSVIEHPSYIKRFHSKNYEWYIKKIKDL